MDHTMTPAVLWLVCLLYIIGLFNHISKDILNSQNPIYIAMGEQTDISKYLCFYWLETIYFHTTHTLFLDVGHEKAGWYVGPTDNIGDILTHQILDAMTLKVVPRSNVHTATNPNTQTITSNTPTFLRFLTMKTTSTSSHLLIWPHWIWIQ